jgi:hypothetical protein
MKAVKQFHMEQGKHMKFAAIASIFKIKSLIAVQKVVIFDNYKFRNKKYREAKNIILFICEKKIRGLFHIMARASTFYLICGDFDIY